MLFFMPGESWAFCGERRVMNEESQEDATSVERLTQRELLELASFIYDRYEEIKPELNTILDQSIMDGRGYEEFDY